MDGRTVIDDFILLNTDVNLLNTLFNICELQAPKETDKKNLDALPFNRDNMQILNINKNAPISSLLRAGKEFDATEVLEVINNSLICTNGIFLFF